MYLDGMSFLEEERETFRPYEALLGLTDEQLDRPVEAAHGWSARDLMGHIAAWQEWVLNVARELAVGTTSQTLERMRSWNWDADGDAINASQTDAWRALSQAEARERAGTIPGELRGYLTVVPEIRWLKDPKVLNTFLDNTTGHYEEHAADLEAVLAANR